AWACSATSARPIPSASWTCRTCRKSPTSSSAVSRPTRSGCRARWPSMPPSEPGGEARMVETVFPDHTNHLGTLFGGQALAWMDKAAFIAASRHARHTVVTARSERLDFHTPVPQGALVELVARVVAAGRSSMEIEVEMHSENLLTG